MTREEFIAGAKQRGYSQEEIDERLATVDNILSRTGEESGDWYYDFLLVDSEGGGGIIEGRPYGEHLTKEEFLKVCHERNMPDHDVQRLLRIADYGIKRIGEEFDYGTLLDK